MSYINCLSKKEKNNYSIFDNDLVLYKKILLGERD